MHDMGIGRGLIMGNYFPTFQVISLIRPPGLPAEIADRRIWRMRAIVRRLAFVHSIILKISGFCGIHYCPPLRDGD